MIGRAALSYTPHVESRIPPLRAGDPIFVNSWVSFPKIRYREEEPEIAAPLDKQVSQSRCDSAFKGSRRWCFRKESRPFPKKNDWASVLTRSTDTPKD